MERERERERERKTSFFLARSRSRVALFIFFARLLSHASLRCRSSLPHLSRSRFFVPFQIEKFLQLAMKVFDLFELFFLFFCPVATEMSQCDRRQTEKKEGGKWEMLAVLL